jgi:DNA-directed RNA polymerase subunit L
MTNLKIIELENIPFKELESSKLTLELSGNIVSTTLANTLRRLAFDYVPTYGFTTETIQIKDNNSIFNNDRMRLRISQMTIPKINVPVSHLDESYWRDIKYDDPNRNKHPKDKYSIEMYINVRNDDPVNLNVTTNHAKFYIDGVEQKPFDNKFPHLIIQLRPKELFNCRAYAVLGVGFRNNIFASVSNAYYEEVSPNKIKLTLHSQGQLHEYDILYRSCIAFNNELNEIKTIIGNKYKNSKYKQEKTIKIKLEGKDHTIGMILNEYLQMNNKLAFSGMSKPDHLIDEVHIIMQSYDKDPLKPFFETIDQLTKIFNNIKGQIKKLGGNYIIHL